MLNPRKFKYNVSQKWRKVFYFCPRHLKFGTMGLRFNSSFLLTSNFIFRTNMFIKKGTKRSEKTLRRFWLLTFPNQPLTRKSQGSRMGKGKGKRFTWGVLVKPGVLIYELKNLRLSRGIYFLSQLQRRLPVQSSIILKSQTIKPSTPIIIRFY